MGIDDRLNKRKLLSTPGVDGIGMKTNKLRPAKCYYCHRDPCVCPEGQTKEPIYSNYAEYLHQNRDAEDVDDKYNPPTESADSEECEDCVTNHKLKFSFIIGSAAIIVGTILNLYLAYKFSLIVLLPNVFYFIGTKIIFRQIKHELLQIKEDLIIERM